MPSAVHPAPADADAPFLDLLGARITLAGADRALLELPYQDGNGNRNGTLHGGVVAAVIDVAAAAVADSGLPAARRAGASTIDFNVHFLAPAIREAVAAEATVVRRGRDITFVEVAVVTGARTIARGMVARRAGAGDGGHTAGARRTTDAGHTANAGRAAGAAADATPTANPRLAAVADDAFLRRNVGSPFTMRLGVASVHLGRGHAMALLPLQEQTRDAAGTVHEGAIAALVDCAGGAASWSVDGFDPSGRAATIGMHLCFDVGTRDENVAAEAVTTWHGEGVYVNSLTVAGRTSGRAIASGSVTYRIVRPPRTR
ncbi:MAG: hotdog fold thioesterase [Deltaproteobacteria bacterium]|nr:hotdog fold thioesterase [Deltaproteobacteria bacterium]